MRPVRRVDNLATFMYRLFEIWEPQPPGNFRAFEACNGIGHNAAGRIMSMKNSSDTIGDRSRDVPTCGVVPFLACTKIKFVYLLPYHYNFITPSLSLLSALFSFNSVPESSREPQTQALQSPISVLHAIKPLNSLPASSVSSRSETGTH
jgi:hypothetical protein